MNNLTLALNLLTCTLILTRGKNVRWRMQPDGPLLTAQLVLSSKAAANE